MPRGRSDASDASKVDLADPVVGDVDAALRQPPARRREVVDRRVVDEVLGAERPCDLELLVGSGRRDDDAAAGRDHLHEELADPAGRSVHEGDVTRAARHTCS